MCVECVVVVLRMSSYTKLKNKAGAAQESPLPPPEEYMTAPLLAPPAWLRLPAAWVCLVLVG